MSARMTDATLERMVSVILRTGTLLSGAVVLAGGVYYLVHHGAEPASYHVFEAQPAVDRMIPRIVAAVFTLRARSIIQLGILLLIATPIARVVLSLVGFAFERDRKYVVVTAIVLAVLLLSLIAGALQA